MSEIKIGEFVRTKEGLIGKVIDKDDNYVFTEQAINYCYSYTGVQIIKNDYEEIKNIKNHSKYIEDLVEAGDYVNGLKVLNVYTPKDVWDTVEIQVNDKHINFIIPDQIETILTHEQFTQNCYIVKEDNINDEN